MSRGKRERNPEAVAQKWGLKVTDSNDDNWLTVFPDMQLGPFATWHPEMTAEIGRDIVLQFTRPRA